MNIVMLLANDGVNDTRVQKESSALAMAGHKVIVICKTSEQAPDATWKGMVEYRRVSPKEPVPPGFWERAKARLRPADKPKLRSLAGASLRQVQGLFLEPAIEAQPDVVVAHDLITLPTAVEVCSSTGAKLVYDSHELEMHSKAFVSMKTEEKEIWRDAEAGNIRRCDAVITVSDRIADHLSKAYAVSRPHVVANGPEDERIKAPWEVQWDLRKHLRLSADTPLMVYVGLLTTHRGVEKVVEAMPHLSGVHFAVVGPKRKKVAAGVKELADKYSVADRLHFVAPVPSEDVTEFIKSADVSVIPIQNACLSYDYCLPNKMFESVLAGLPVAASNLTELRDFMGRFPVGLLMDEKSPESIAGAIKTILDDRTKYAPTDDVIAAVRSEYGWKTQSKRLVALFDSLK